MGFLNTLLGRFTLHDQSLNKRYKFIITTAIFLFLQIIFILFYSDYERIKQGIAVPFLIFFAISLVVFIYPIVLQITLKNIFKIISVPFGYLLSSFLLLVYFPNLNILFKFAFAGFSAFVFYYLVLATNIFLVVEEKGRTIPLVRPAKTAFLFIEITTLFFVLTTVFKTLLGGSILELTFVFHALVVFFVSYFFALQYWWSQNLEKDISSLVGNESLVIAIIMFLTTLSISFIPIESFFKALLLTTIYYICISFLQAVVLHRLDKSLYVEFALILLFIIIFLVVA